MDDALKKGVNNLFFYEERLKMYETSKKIKLLKEKLSKQPLDEETRKLLEEIERSI